MIILIPLIIIAVLGFGILQYQSIRDKRRWKRIQSGKSLFGERNDLPPLEVDGVSIEPKNRPIVVVWNDLNSTGYFLAEDARKQVSRQNRSQNPKAHGARIFAWDGKQWKPLAYTSRP